MNRYGYEIHEARKKSGITLEKLAKKCGTHKGYISGIENGKVNPPAARVTRRIAAALGLKEDRLLALKVISVLPRRLPMSTLVAVCGEILRAQAQEDSMNASIADAHSEQALKRETA